MWLRGRRQSLLVVCQRRRYVAAGAFLVVLAAAGRAPGWAVPPALPPASQPAAVRGGLGAPHAALPSVPFSGLRYDLRVDVPVTAAALAGWIVSEALKSRLAPASCHWCAVNKFDAAARQSLRWHSTGTADTLSSVTVYALAPLAASGLYVLAAGHESAWRDFPRRDLLIDGVLVVEATALAMDLSEVMKLSVGRERPFVHVLPAGEKRRTADPADNNTSFLSGHVTLAFALASAAGTLAFLRRYRWAGWVLGAGLVVATTTAYLRVAADRHYLSDVMTSATVGSAVGFGVPWFWHRRPPDTRGSGVRLLPLAAPRGGAGMSVLWVR